MPFFQFTLNQHTSLAARMWFSCPASLGASFEQAGRAVTVTDVQAGGALHLTGVQSGDRIVAVNGRSVGDLPELLRSLSRAELLTTHTHLSVRRGSELRVELLKRK